LDEAPPASGVFVVEGYVPLDQPRDVVPAEPRRASDADAGKLAGSGKPPDSRFRDGEPLRHLASTKELRLGVRGGIG